LANPLLAVASSAIQGDKCAVLGVTAGDLRERVAGPSDARRGTKRRLGLARRPDIGGDPERTANRGPCPQCRPILLLAAQYNKAQDHAYREQACGRPPADPRPRVFELEWP
jgi:hypothetical protein